MQQSLFSHLKINNSFNYKTWLVPGFAVLLLFLSVSVYADEEKDMEAALNAVKEKNFEKAFKHFMTLAESGNAEAQHNIAMLYRQGLGVEKDLTVSARWFRKAADQDIADAQYYLGHMYDNGEGVEKNAQYAFVWYRRAAEKGQGLAQINLGVMYANGLGVAQDVEQAYLWFHVGAAQGYKTAFENKQIIEENLEPEVVEDLKLKARSYVQRFLIPYQQHRRPYPLLR